MIAPHRGIPALVLPGILAALVLTTPTGAAAASDAATEGCDSPRTAVYTLLYWLQAERYDAERAAECQDRSRLDDPDVDGPRLADKFLKVLDARGLFVQVDTIPDRHDYKDASERERYPLLPNDLSGIELVKQGDRWVFSSESLARIPAMYADTLPDWLVEFVDELPPALQGEFLGLKGWQWIGFILLLVAAWFGRLLATLLIQVVLKRMISRLGPTSSWLENLFGNLGGAVGGLVLALVLIYVQPYLQLPIAMSAVLLAVGRLAGSVSLLWLLFVLIDAFSAGLARRAEETESRMDDQIVPLVRKSLKVVAGVLGLLWILQSLHLDVTSLIATASVASLGVALAAKDTVANVFGSVMVFVDKPFQIGDFVTIGSGVTGTVEEVGFRTSRLRTPSGSLITIPNARMTDTEVENLGERPNRRYDIVLGLTYDTSADKVEAFCAGVEAVIEAHPLTEKDRKVVRFIGFGPSSLDVMVRCWFDTQSYDQEQDCKHVINMEILRLAEALGVAFAFPSQSLYVEQMPSDGASGGSPVDAAQVASTFGPGGSQSRAGDWWKG